MDEESFASSKSNVLNKIKVAGVTTPKNNQIIGGLLNIISNHAATTVTNTNTSGPITGHKYSSTQSIPFITSNQLLMSSAKHSQKQSASNSIVIQDKNDSPVAYVAKNESVQLELEDVQI